MTRYNKELCLNPFTANHVMAKAEKVKNFVALSYAVVPPEVFREAKMRQILPQTPPGELRRCPTPPSRLGREIPSTIPHRTRRCRPSGPPNIDEGSTPAYSEEDDAFR